MNQTLFVGIDVSLKSNQVCALNFNQDKLFNLSFDNTPSGSEKLIELIVDLVNEHHFNKVIFAMECTGVYYIHVATFFKFQHDSKQP